MEFSDDEEAFILTQESVKDYCDTQSSQYGLNVVDSNDIVSLETGDNGNFTLDVDGIMDYSQPGTSDSIQIENISSDEDADLLDIEDVIRRSQEPMLNPLTIRSGGMKRKSDESLDLKGNIVGEIIGGSKKVRREFKAPCDNVDIEHMSHRNFAPESKKKIKWAVNMYCEWRLSRMSKTAVPIQIVRADLDDLYNVQQSDLCFALSRFISEVKKVDNSDYPPNSLKEIIVMIQMFLNEHGVFWRLLDQQSVNFQCLRNVVDNLMRQRTAMGLGIRVSSSVISLGQEDRMFQLGILGEENPVVLLKTVIYMLGLHLALRGGVEHTRLRRPGFNCQIQVNIDDKGREILLYTEDLLQKANQGGLGTRYTSKKVQVYVSQNGSRCPVRLFKKYCGLLPPPKSCRKLYLRPKIKFNPRVWYCDQAYGCNKVTETVKELCKEAGFEGKYTNHLLRATSASRMFESDVPEQVIKEITGHRSDCVRIYKRTSDDIKQNASATFSGEKLKDVGKIDENGKESKESDGEYSSEKIDNLISYDDRKHLAESLSACQMIKNVIRSKMEFKNKSKKGVKLVKKVANKLVKKHKCKVAIKKSNNKITINLNVNLNMQK